ncbi:MAG: tRNA (guanosine(46)-N7)-methyltransferase TrmB [Deltaproteobacteria bacterium]|nr:tRNA (guanosine(46)-N7)-methyltransferase TrmB [Deltaproteobacteria bacterium]
MATSARPTPQAPAIERPRFKDKAPSEFPSAEVNPYLSEHWNYGVPVLTADQAWRYQGRWEEAFGRPGPLHVEIGSGNGFFLTELARRNPDWNVLGIEIRYKRVVMCADKLRKAGVTNARISRYHAAYLDDLFLDGCMDGLYVNHPDPWPKTRHDKNRLISRWFLEETARFLRPGGHFRLKSDFRPNIQRVAELLEGSPLPLKITGRSEDITHGDAPWPDDIETNYQSKFRLKGEPVYAIEVIRVDGQAPPRPVPPQ